MAQLLLDMRLLDEPTLRLALRDQRVSGRRLPQILAMHNVVDEERLARAIASALGIDIVQPATLKIHGRVLELVPAPLAVLHGVLPFAVQRTNDEDVLHLAMADPLDREAIDDIARTTRHAVRVAVAPATELEAAIHRWYRADPLAPPRQSTPPEARTPISREFRRPSRYPLRAGAPTSLRRAVDEQMCRQGSSAGHLPAIEDAVVRSTCRLSHGTPRVGEHPFWRHSNRRGGAPARRRKTRTTSIRSP